VSVKVTFHAGSAIHISPVRVAACIPVRATAGWFYLAVSKPAISTSIVPNYSKLEPHRRQEPHASCTVEIDPHTPQSLHSAIGNDTISASFQETNTMDLISQLNQLQLMHCPNTIVAPKQQSSRKNAAGQPSATHLTVRLDERKTAQHMQDLLDKSLIFYFTDYPPSQKVFYEWAETQLADLQGWPLTQIK
jgi:hypothetical protein